ncbi:MAG: hypothetical protein ACFCU2_07455 [Acidimicrobiia bacterium]
MRGLIEPATQRREPAIKSLFKLLLILGIAGFVVSYLNGKKLEYAGLTETEARRKLEEKLAPKVGKERAAEIAGQVIPRLKERGVVIDDPIAEAVDEMVDDIRTSTSGADGS